MARPKAKASQQSPRSSRRSTTTTTTTPRSSEKSNGTPRGRPRYRRSANHGGPATSSLKMAAAAASAHSPEPSATDCLDASLSMLHTSMENAKAYEYLVEDCRKPHTSSASPTRRHAEHNTNTNTTLLPLPHIHIPYTLFTLTYLHIPTIAK